MEVPSAVNPELSRLSSAKPGVGQNIALHALPVVRNSALLTVCLLRPFSFIFFQSCSDGPYGLTFTWW